MAYCWLLLARHPIRFTSPMKQFQNCIPWNTEMAISAGSFKSISEPLGGGEGMWGPWPFPKTFHPPSLACFSFLSLLTLPGWDKARQAGGLFGLLPSGSGTGLLFPSPSGDDCGINHAVTITNFRSKNTLGRTMLISVSEGYSSHGVEHFWPCSESISIQGQLWWKFFSTSGQLRQVLMPNCSKVVHLQGFTATATLRAAADPKASMSNKAS